MVFRLPRNVVPVLVAAPCAFCFNFGTVDIAPALHAPPPLVRERSLPPLLAEQLAEEEAAQEEAFAARTAGAGEALPQLAPVEEVYEELVDAAEQKETQTTLETALGQQRGATPTSLEAAAAVAVERSLVAALQQMQRNAASQDQNKQHSEIQLSGAINANVPFPERDVSERPLRGAQKKLQKSFESLAPRKNESSEALLDAAAVQQMSEEQTEQQEGAVESDGPTAAAVGETPEAAADARWPNLPVNLSHPGNTLVELAARLEEPSDGSPRKPLSPTFPVVRSFPLRPSRSAKIPAIPQRTFGSSNLPLFDSSKTVQASMAAKRAGLGLQVLEPGQKWRLNYFFPPPDLPPVAGVFGRGVSVTLSNQHPPVVELLPPEEATGLTRFLQLQNQQQRSSQPDGGGDDDTRDTQGLIDAISEGEKNVNEWSDDYAKLNGNPHQAEDNQKAVQAAAREAFTLGETRAATQIARVEELANKRDELTAVAQTRLTKYWFIGQCVRDYDGNDCPLDWELSPTTITSNQTADGGLCLPPETYNGICGPTNLAGAVPRVKESFAWKCAVEWPCKMPPLIDDWTTANTCPDGWTSPGHQLCIAPPSYKGPCSLATDFADFDPEAKARWAAVCGAVWSSHVSGQGGVTPSLLKETGWASGTEHEGPVSGELGGQLLPYKGPRTQWSWRKWREKR